MTSVRTALATTIGLAVAFSSLPVSLSQKSKPRPAASRSFARSGPKGNAQKALRSKYKATRPKKKGPKAVFTLAYARQIAGRPDVKKQPIALLARALYILEVESPGDAKSLRQKIQNRVVLRDGERVNTTPQIEALVTQLHRVYTTPCAGGSLQRVGTSWPPEYKCAAGAAPSALPPEPMPLISLSQRPKIYLVAGEADQKKEPIRQRDDVRQKRVAEINARDKKAWSTEDLRAPPRSFCVGGRCLATYKEVASALYPRHEGADNLPVYCVPKYVGGRWEIDRVHCTKDWVTTLNWMPWCTGGDRRRECRGKKAGDPADPPERGTIPPYACFGNPHFLSRHVLLPESGKAGQGGFRCRKRIFKVLAQRAEKSMADVYANVGNMCAQMRKQVWGEKYPDIQKSYYKWCMQQASAGRLDKALCVPDKTKKGKDGKAVEVGPPFMYLTREELLYFFGHQELYCRADRKGLVHFLYNTKPANDFICGVDRGLLEAGPFEEGVQACAIIPYFGENAPVWKDLNASFKGRLHCWSFNRPTCEQVTLEGKLKDEQRKLDSIHKSNVFDSYDTLREYRRTREKKVFSLLDLKDAEKMRGWQDVESFSDAANDEGIFGVKEFCRFVGGFNKIQCGYDKQTMQRWYEMRRGEKPRNCYSGVCERGAYQKGYLCGIFSSPELFAGKPYWMCGVDTGVVGRRALENSRALCLGGKIVEGFLSPKGERGSLHCYERRFKWGESSQSREMLERFDWNKMVSDAADAVLKDVLADDARHAGLIQQAESVFQKTDRPQILAFAKETGHTLAHRTSMRILVIREKKLQAVQQFLATNLTPQTITYVDEDVRGKTETRGGKTVDKEAEARNQKTKDLNDLIGEIRKGDRAADGKWLVDWFKEAVEGGKERIARQTILLGVRVALVFHTLDVARRLLQEYARDYANEVMKKAKTTHFISRLEVHDRARIEEFQKEGIRGNVYCVPDAPPQLDDAKNPNRRYFVCASSPLLALGMVEQTVRDREKGFAPSEEAKTAEDSRRELEAFREKSRVQVKTEWCFGSTKGDHVFGGINKLPPLYGKDLSSPYFMELPIDGTIDLTNRQHGYTYHKDRPWVWTNKINWVKCAGFQYTDENWQRASAKKPGKPAGSGGGGGGAGAVLSAIGGLAGMLVGGSSGKIANFAKMIQDMTHAAGEFIQTWKERYLELVQKQWEESQKKISKAEEDLDKLKAEKDEEIAKAQAAAEKAQGDLDTTRGEFQGKLDTVEAEQQKNVDDIEKEYFAAEGKYVAAKDAYWEKKVEATADPKNKDKADEAKEAKGEMDRVKKEGNEKMKDAEKAKAKAIAEAKKKLEDEVKAKEKDLEAAKKAWEKTKEQAKKTIDKATDALNKMRQKEAEANKTLQNTGELFNMMADELTKLITSRVMQPIEPIVRDLFGKAFQIVRKILGAIAKVVIGALASIPFVGGALAVIGHIAFEFGMDKLEEFCVEKLLELVERVISKLVRSFIPLVMKPMQGAILKLLHSECGKIVDREGAPVCSKDGELKFSELPPQHRWLNRALYACDHERINRDMLRQIEEHAVASNQRLMERLREMQEQAPMYARMIADDYFRAHGTSYEEWMAAVAPGAHPTKVAKIERVTKALRSLADDAIRTRQVPGLAH